MVGEFIRTLTMVEDDYEECKCCLIVSLDSNTNTLELYKGTRLLASGLSYLPRKHGYRVKSSGNAETSISNVLITDEDAGVLRMIKREEAKEKFRGKKSARGKSELVQAN